jgi:hypothetical protein
MTELLRIFGAAQLMLRRTRGSRPAHALAF